MNIADMINHPVEEFSSHSPSLSTSSLSSSSPSRKKSGVSKRKQTKAACLACRKRKSKCNGNRPVCNTCGEKGSLCSYSVEEGVTQQQATKEQLNMYKSVLMLLRDSSPVDREAIIHHLKIHDNLNQAVKLVHESRLLLQGD